MAAARTVPCSAAAGRRLTLGAALFAGLLLATPAIAEGPRSDCPAVFREVAVERGIDFVHRTGAAGEKHLPETMGAGLAWVDFDGDGWLDLYLVQSGPFPPDRSGAAQNRLFRNLGEKGDGVAFEALDRPGLGDRGYGQGVTAADIEGDGDLDLYIANYGADVLLLNRGDGGAEALPLASSTEWSSSGAFADTDGDGDLDLYVTRYLDYRIDHRLYCGDRKGSGEREYCDPSLFPGLSDLFYRNHGEGRLVDASAEVGLAGASGKGLGVVLIDLDSDHRPDLYVANDITPNLLFRNRPGGVFEDLSLLSGAAVNREGRPEAGMGVAAADFDGDGDVDLAVTNFDVETNTLYSNRGSLFFDDVSAESGFGLPSFNRLGFGLVEGDFDLDGDLDVFVANGHIFERPHRENVAYRQADMLLLGDRGRFRELTCVDWGVQPAVGRGAASADYDGDGDLDLAVSNSNDRPFLFENSTSHGDWLGVALVGRPPNTEAIGAEVVLRSARGEQRRWVIAGGSYQSSRDRRLLFALTGGSVAELEVRWPSGQRQRWQVTERNRYLRLVERAGPSR